MEQRLVNDRSLAPLIAQFVPLKIKTSSPDWGKINKRFPLPGNTIPVVYVIRADGKKIYADRSTLSGNQLPTVLQLSLRQAGCLLNDTQARMVIQTVSATKTALAADDPYAASLAIKPLAKFGVLGQLQSYAKPIQDANAVVMELVDRGEADLKQIAAFLGKEETQFAGGLQLFAGLRTYSFSLPLKKAFAIALRDASSKTELEQVLLQARAIDKARALVYVRGGKPKAIEALNRLAVQYEGTEGARVVAEQLQKIADSAPVPK